jgi:hypothetical protein
MPHGPNVKRLIIRKMAIDMVPPGGGINDALATMIRPGGIEEHARSATAWVEAALAAVKAAPGNPFGGDDEAIAAEILRGVEARRVADLEAIAGQKARVEAEADRRLDRRD